MNVGFMYTGFLAVNWRARQRLLREKRNRWDSAGG